MYTTMNPFLIIHIVSVICSIHIEALNNQNSNNVNSETNKRPKKRGIAFNYPQTGSFLGASYGGYGSNGQFPTVGLSQFIPNYQQGYGQQLPQQPFYGQPQGMALPTSPYPSFSPAFSAPSLGPQAFPPHGLPPQALPSHALSPHAFSTNALHSHALPSHALPPHAFPPHALSPHAFSPHALPPHTLSSHPLLSQYTQQRFSGQQFQSPFSISQYNPHNSFSRSLIPQIPKTYGSAESQRSGFQYGFQQGSPATFQQNEVESSHEIESPKSHISSSDQSPLVSPESEINYSHNEQPDNSGQMSRSYRVNDDRSPSSLYNSIPRTEILRHFNVPKFLFSEYNSGDNQYRKGNASEHNKVTRSSPFFPKVINYDIYSNGPKKGFVKIQFGNTKIEY